MNVTKIVQSLGVLAIAGSAISFVMEGWNEFNDPIKYMIFFGFMILLFILAELYKKTSSSLFIIFSSLSLMLVPAVSAQLGSMILDKTTDQLFLITMASTLLLNGLIFKVLLNLESKRPVLDQCLFIAMSALFLIPERTSSFHGLIIMALTALTLLISHFSKFERVPSYANIGLRLMGLIFLTGRACLYQVDSNLLSVIYGVSGLVCLLYLRHAFTNDMGKQSFTFVGYVLAIMSCLEVANFGYWTHFRWTLVLVEGVLLSLTLWIPDTKKYGSFFMVFFGWVGLIHQICTEVTLVDYAIGVTLPLVIMALGYFARHSLTFFSSTILFIASVSWYFIKLIKLPVMNMWMIFGVVGLLLLISSSLVGSSTSPLRVLWNKLMKEFEA